MRHALAVALALVLSACTVIAGSGTVTTEARAVGAFKTLEVDSALTVVATLGPRAVTVTTDQNLQAYVEVVVLGDTLRLRIKPGISLTAPTRLEAAVANDVLEGITGSGAVKVTAVASPVGTFPVVASGASTVTVSSVAATTLTVDASGASHVTASGAATSGTLTASGSSEVDTRGVPLTTATVDVSGSSTLRAAVSQSLSGTVSGASQALIAGHPASTVSTSGASTVQLDHP